jgi:DNA excision repair protein ERCC-2
MSKEINLSVHGLVDFLLRKGDIDTRIYNQSSMAEGTRVHLRYQQIQDGTYLSEQALEVSLSVNDFVFNLNGRADGIICGKNIPIIDEIKSTVDDLEHFYESQKEWHLGQAKCYAYMYGKMNNLSSLGVRLTYISQKDFEDRLVLNFSYTIEELEKYVTSLCEKYLEFYQNIYQHNLLKIESAGSLIFPYSFYRPGQKEMAKYVYGTIKKGETLFVEAPTGIGKTMSTLFPAVKSFNSLGVEKIFYLSAKTVAKNVAYEASKKLIENGLIARAIKIQSKEKMCQMDSRKCNPDDCPFALGYYDKLKNAIDEIITNNNLIDDNVILSTALREEMCPFELQLDVSLYSDIIICDYNYFFDPFVYLKRFFDATYVPYVALVDESHNLVDRSKEMYSCELDLSMFERLHKEFKRVKAPKLKKYLKKIMLNLMSHYSEEQYVLVENDFDVSLYTALDNFFKQSQDLLKNEPDNATDLFLECFRQVNRFIKLSEYIDENFCLYYETSENKNVKAIIKCVDSSSFVKNSVNTLQATVFFSATLSPIEYYISSLGGEESSPNAIFHCSSGFNNLTP